MFQKCILHIGVGKTGTTSIQVMLQEQRTALLEHNIYFADHGPCHIFLASAFCDHPENLSIHFRNQRTDPRDIEAYNKWHLNTLREAAENNTGKILILSCEHLSAFTLSEAQLLASFLSTITKEIEILCYVREPVDHAISLHLEYVRNDRARLKAPLTDSYLSAQKTLETYEAAFTASPIHVRQYNKDAFPNGNVAADFLNAIGAEHISLNGVLDTQQNVRFSHEALLLIDKLNKKIPQRNGDGWNLQHAKDLKLGDISGQIYQPSKKEIETIQMLASKDRAFLEDKYAFQFSGYQPANHQETELWQERTLESLANLLNQQALEIEKLRAELAYRDGLIAKGEGNFAEAISQFKLSLLIRPDFRSSVRGLAETYMEQGCKDKAIYVCKTFISRNSDDVYFRLELAKVYIALKEKSAAFQTVKQALEFEPKNNEALRLLKLLRP